MLIIIVFALIFFSLLFLSIILFLGFHWFFWDPSCLNDLHMLILLVIYLLCVYLIFQSNLMGYLKIWSSCICPVNLLLICRESFNEELSWVFVLWKYSIHLWFLWLVEWSSHESSYRQEVYCLQSIQTWKKSSFTWT